MFSVLKFHLQHCFFQESEVVKTKMYVPIGIFTRGNFQRVFSQVATILKSENSQAETSQVCSSRSARPLAGSRCKAWPLAHPYRSFRPLLQPVAPQKA